MKKKSKNRKKANVADLAPKTENPTGGATSSHSGGVNVLMGDGSVRFVSSTVPSSSTTTAK